MGTRAPRRRRLIDRDARVTALLAERVGYDERFLNRELSWLDFNDRVLSLASEPGIPLLERAKFCAICSINLDEFFQVRVAALKDQIAAGIDDPTPDGRSPAQQLDRDRRACRAADRAPGVDLRRQLVPR